MKTVTPLVSLTMNINTQSDFISPKYFFVIVYFLTRIK